MRSIVLVVSVGVVLAVSGASVSRGADAGSGVPNIVLLLTDDQRFDELGPIPRTVRLIGGAGVTFSNYNAMRPLCGPQRATILTGQYQHNHHVNCTDTSWQALQRKDDLLPVWLQKAGYRTGYIGKLINGLSSTAQPPAGWTPDLWRNGGSDPVYCGFWLHDPDTDGRKRYGELKWPCDQGVYQTDVEAELAAEVVRREASVPGPFFLGVGFSAPHTGAPQDPSAPLALAVPPPRYLGAFDSVDMPHNPAFNEADASDKPRPVRKMLLSEPKVANIERAWRRAQEAEMAIDDAVATIVRALEESGELDNTVLIFTSDNGYERGEHRLNDGKGQPYTESVRLPLLIRGPGFPSGTTVSSLVSTVDLAPTILDLADAAPGLRTIDGQSILPLLDGTALARSRLLVEGGVWRSLLTADGWQFTSWYLANQRELYDLNADPWQLENLANDPAYKPKLAELRTELDAVKKCVGSACP